MNRQTASPGPFSPLVERIGGRGADAWRLHREAMAARRRGEDVIVLSVGDPDFDTPPSVVDAAVDALRGGDTHYTPISGRSTLREAVARRFAARAGMGVDPDQVVIVAGAQNGLFSTALCLLAAGDEVIVPAPMYVTYEATLGAAGARMVPVACDADAGFRPDPARIAAAVSPATRALFLANPNNPTGVVLRRDELEAIAELANRHDLWVVSDEVYADLVFDGEHVSVASLPGMAQRTVTVSSLSKSHAMPGWRSGWVVAPPALAPHLERLSLCMLYGLPGFIQAAAEAALAATDDHVVKLRRDLKRRRDLLLGALSGIKRLRCTAPQAGMFLLVDVRDTGLASDAFAERLYQDTGVAVLDAAPFGAGASDGFVRLAFGESEQALGEACRRIGAFVDALPGGRIPRHRRPGTGTSGRD